MAKIYPEIHVMDIIEVEELAQAIQMRAAIGFDAISVESVIYTRESLGVTNDYWFEMGLSPNPDWRRSMIGFTAHAEPLLARWFVSTRGLGVTQVSHHRDLTKQIFMHGLILPTILTLIHISDLVSVDDISQTLTCEVYYHGVSMERDELVALNNRWGRVRRTS